MSDAPFRLYLLCCAAPIAGLVKQREKQEVQNVRRPQEVHQPVVLVDGRIVATWVQGQKIMSELFDTRTSGKIIKGTDDSNNLLGTQYSDRIYGFGGNDWLIGDFRSDVLIGGPGADKLYGDPGNDTASYASGVAGVTVNLQTNMGAGGDAEGDVLVEIENLTGSKGNDTLIGDTDSNVIKGGSGNDKLYGGELDDSLFMGAGKDYADGGTGVDLVSWLGSVKSVKVDLADYGANGGEAAGDTYINVENIGGTDSSDTLLGNSGQNYIYGYKARDVIDGRAGGDIIVGGRGSDVLTGGTGRDFFRLMNPAEGSDNVNDFRKGDSDEISIYVKGFGGTLKAGGMPSSQLVKAASPVPVGTGSVFLYDTDSGKLYFDVDGTGATPKVELMTLVGLPDIGPVDFHLF